jgi:glycosyltransferase involved in cell wall biosynthesis
MERKVTRRLLSEFRWAFPRAFRILPDNKYSAKEYEHYGIKASVTWLPNTVDTEIFHPPLQSARKPWLLHASGMTPQKRFPDIVRAFSQVLRKRPDAMLHVAGDGASRAEMERFAASTLPANSFCFHGYVSKRQLSDLMRQASGFVLPSEAENLPCVLVEALASACPVLTTRVGGIMALVDEDQGLLVEVGNVEQITEGMCRLLDSTHMFDMNRISAAVRAQYSREAVGRILHEEYRKAVAVSS